MNALFGEPFSRSDLVPAGLEAESIVSGYHADNIAPALMGGFVLIRRVPGAWQHGFTPQDRTTTRNRDRSRDRNTKATHSWGAHGLITLEGVVSGYHGDSIAPALMARSALIRQALEGQRLC